MSVEAISWALNLAPVPTDRGGQPSSACKFVLVGLANHASPDGTAAFPSVARLVIYTGLSERTVRSSLSRLEAAGIIRPCDPAIVAARVKRADRRPNGWDLDLNLIRDDLDDAEIATLERQFPGLASRVAAARRVSADGVRPLPPVPDAPVDNVADEVRPLHPVSGAGCNQRSHGVQPAQPRGAVVAPEPYIEPSREPPATTTRACEAAARSGVGGGGRAGEFFDILGEDWRLTTRQRARLAPAVEVALDAGWAPRALAAFTGGNAGGVRSPYAVLASRLSPAELPAPPGCRPPRPPWCGECDEQTRRRQHDDGADGGRCPACHPLVAGDEGHPERRPTMTKPAWLVSQLRDHGMCEMCAESPAETPTSASSRWSTCAHVRMASAVGSRP